MSSCPVLAPVSTPNEVIERLRRFVVDLDRHPDSLDDFEAFELELRDMVMEVEAEIVRFALSKVDIDAPMVLIGGVEHRRAIRCSATYQTSAGKVSVERTLYRPPGGGPCVAPMDLRAGIVEGTWTPRAAKQGIFALAHLPTETAAEMFETIGCMTPSKSGLDRLGKQVGATWESRRTELEAAMRRSARVPASAVTVAVSLDGVMVQMRDGDRAGKRARAIEEGKQPSGPAGHREVGCATVSFYDADGNRLETTRYGRMPSSGKPELKAWLQAELAFVLAQRPDLRVAKVADGAKDNWTFLDGESMPDGESVLDFFHASEHLASSLAAAYGEGTEQFRRRFLTLRRRLRDDEQGADKIVRAMRYLRGKHPRSKIIQRELEYFRRNRGRMHYAHLQALHFPIGSGVVEAACKSLVADRMKRSGMRWAQAGGQAVLTFRALAQSGRFQRGWDAVVATYKATVEMPDKVIPFPAARR